MIAEYQDESAITAIIGSYAFQARSAAAALDGPLSHDAPSSGELHPRAGLTRWLVKGSFCVTCAHAAAGEGAYCGLMKPSRAAPRRYLPGSPFNVEVPESPVETYELRDLVTHDKYGLGTVLGVEGDTALLVDFGTHRMRILIPCAKLFKL